MHLLPTRDGLGVAWRIDGALHQAGKLPPEVSANVVARFKVLADLLTYETQKPQEGRLNSDVNASPVRISTMPTLFGEKLVARVLPAGVAKLGRLADLELPPAAEAVLADAMLESSGLILIVGPAGSGKTTTAYALIREIAAASRGARSIASLEDPVEVELPGVAQSQAAPHAGFDLATGLRSLVRQDPEVILVGEVRDAETAGVAYQAALTGQLVITTFHAADIASALIRLIDMGMPPYVVRGATRVVVAQRLVRQLCECSLPDEIVGCRVCRGAGYRGRVPIAEAANLQTGALAGLLSDSLTGADIRAALREADVKSLAQQAGDLVANGATSLLEVARILGNAEAQ